MPLSMNKDVFITCAVTGSGGTQDRSPHVPRSPAQIAESAIDAAKAGAAVVHCHVRDPDTGKPSRDPGYYREVTDRIRESEVDVVLIDRRDSNLVFAQISPGLVSTPNTGLTVRIVASFTDEQLAEVLTCHKDISHEEAWQKSIDMLKRVNMPDVENVMVGGLVAAEQVFGRGRQRSALVADGDRPFLGAGQQVVAAQKKEEDSVYKWGRWAVLSPAAGGPPPYVAALEPDAVNNARPEEAEEFSPQVEGLAEPEPPEIVTWVPAKAPASFPTEPPEMIAWLPSRSSKPSPTAPPGRSRRTWTRPTGSTTRCRRGFSSSCSAPVSSTPRATGRTG